MQYTYQRALSCVTVTHTHTREGTLYDTFLILPYSTLKVPVPSQTSEPLISKSFYLSFLSFYILLIGSSLRDEIFPHREYKILK